MILELTRQNILNLTNESKRKNILAAWRSWGIWHKAPEIGLSVYRLDLPDGSFFTASWYERAMPSFRAAVRITSTVRATTSAAQTVNSRQAASRKAC